LSYLIIGFYYEASPDSSFLLISMGFAVYLIYTCGKKRRSTSFDHPQVTTASVGAAGKPVLYSYCLSINGTIP